MKDTNLPTRPPTRPAALLTPAEALLNDDPADDETLVRPSEALEVTLEAVSLAFDTVFDAA